MVAYSRVLRPGVEREAIVAIRGSGDVCDARGSAIETSASRQIQITTVLLTKHFEHSKVCASKPGFSGSMSRNDIVSSHFDIEDS
jgi:hypothetical protein